MSYFFHLLDEHAQLLKERGFDEKGLNSPMREGYLRNCLQQNLSNAIQESRFDNGPISFTLEAVGFFNNNKDMLFFKLYYVFDPVSIDLLLKKLNIADTERLTEFILVKSQDLPVAENCVKLLDKGTNFRQNRTVRLAPENKNEQTNRLRR